jgi:hypothetical protein
MTAQLISARVAPMDVSRAARRCDFMGTDSRASVVRYALARVAGYSHDQAKSLAYGQPLNGVGDTGMVVHGTQITAKIDTDLLAKAESAMPAEISDRATLIRYALALAAEYSHEEALDEARRQRTGRPKGSKNKPKVAP